MSATVWAVDREMSLAWKLLWLETDMYPQGKDLYDAALLAEQTNLSPQLLLRVLRSSGEWHGSRESLAPDFPMQWRVDWDNFKLEHPQAEGEAKNWQLRLNNALSFMFAEKNEI